MDEGEKTVAHSAPSDSGMKVMAITLMAAALILSGVMFYSVNSINSNLIALREATLSAKFVAIQQAGTQPTQPTQPTEPTQPTQPTQPTFDLAGKTPRGDASAKVTIVEYSDFQCPYCSRAVPTVEQILKDYDGEVKVYFKHFPLGFHQYAEKAAEAAECASDQGKFWEYHDKLFANQQALTTTDLKKYAGDLGLDTTKFNTCLDTGAKESAVQADFDEGTANGIQGTPSFFINGEVVVGAQPYDAFKTVIDDALKAA